MALKYLFPLLLLISCTDPTLQKQTVQNEFPKAIVSYPSQTLSYHAYDMVVEDTIEHKIYAVKFKFFSNTKIYSIELIK